MQIFATATIGGSNKVAQAENTISLTLIPQVLLPAGAHVTLKELVGSLPILNITESRAFKSVQPQGILAASYKWKNEACAVLSDVDRPLTATTSSSTVQGTQTVCAIMGMGQNCKVFPDVLKVKYMPGILFAVANDTTST